MSNHPRRFWETHGGTRSPLLVLLDHVRERGTDLSPADVGRLAAEARVPESTIRGALTYYADLGLPPETARVCDGTSCRLTGADALRRELEGERPVHPVYCLGYCHESPVTLVDGEVRGVGGAPRRSSLPDIRVLCREPLVTRRLVVGGTPGLEQARSMGAYETLTAVLEKDSPEQVLREVEASGERGRGGAGFPTGRKWRACAEAPVPPDDPERFVVANGDEGDPGSFIDRLLMEHDPHAVLEGLLLCGYAVGARRGIVYVRSEYPEALARMSAAIDEAYAAGLLGAQVAGTGFAFDVSVFPGMGSYVCGEETAMLNAIEGFRGQVRLRPPYPAQAGLYGRPTVVNNVETLSNVPVILGMGADAYRRLGTEASAGTKALCLNAGFARPGVVEVEFGIPLREVIDEAGGGAGGAELEAVIVGGPMGSILTPDQWDVPVCYGAMGARGQQLGHGGLVALPAGADPAALLEHWLEFMVHESCGRCVPCRDGSAEGLALLRRPGTAPPASDGIGRAPDVGTRLAELFELMELGSLCAFGENMPGPMRTLLERYGEAALGGRGRAKPSWRSEGGDA